jgi:hypothetical protein
MNITKIIEIAAESFKASGNLTPSHCDVRCFINDVIADCDEQTQKRCECYDQTRAWMRVRRMLGTPVKREDVPWKGYCRQDPQPRTTMETNEPESD